MSVAMNTAARHALLALGCLIGGASRAHAFSDPVTFADPVQMGGGGGRYFTGSATDGYGCNVCHRGGESAETVLFGLPLAGYRPGAAYEARVEWPASLEHVGLELEITDSAGQRAGELRLPPENELPNEERCEPVEDGFPAGELIELEQRTLLSVVDCGAKRVRFLWIAPSEARGTLRFSGGLVASDGEADAAGDGVTLFAHELPEARSGVTPTSEISGGCSVTAPTTHSAGAGFWLAALSWAAWRVRRRVRAR